jgi:hypothetical protein
MLIFLGVKSTRNGHVTNGLSSDLIMLISYRLKAFQPGLMINLTIIAF